MARKKLLKIYDLYETWACEYSFACRKGCASCCTQSVSITTLEGELITDYIKSQKRELLPPPGRLAENYLNQQTTNQFAAACLRREYQEDNAPRWNMTPCIFLRDNCCTIYPVRSFMCRSFGSKVPCDINGEAEVDPAFLTLNTVILQCIEHLDRGRPWGNMNGILSLAENSTRGEHCPTKGEYELSRPIPGFLIPPEEIDALHAKLEILLKIIT